MKPQPYSPASSSVVTIARTSAVAPACAYAGSPAGVPQPNHAIRNRPRSTAIRHAASQHRLRIFLANDRFVDAAQHGVDAVQLFDSQFGLLAFGDIADRADRAHRLACSSWVIRQDSSTNFTRPSGISSRCSSADVERLSSDWMNARAAMARSAGCTISRSLRASRQTSRRRFRRCDGSRLTTRLPS